MVVRANWLCVWQLSSRFICGDCGAGSATGGKAVLDLEGVWHPCVNPAVGRSVVPNNLQLGNRWGLTPPTAMTSAHLHFPGCMRQI